MIDVLSFPNSVCVCASEWRENGDKKLRKVEDAWRKSTWHWEMEQFFLLIYIKNNVTLSSANISSASCAGIIESFCRTMQEHVLWNFTRLTRVLKSHIGIFCLEKKIRKNRNSIRANLIYCQNQNNTFCQLPLTT